MIICPKCKEEIDDDSHFCDQCGQALLYCNQCGRVGIGRRCTHCGGLMVTLEEYQRAVGSQTALSMSVSSGVVSYSGSIHPDHSEHDNTQKPARRGIPVLTLYNPSLNIRIDGINGAVIGHRQGPYTKYFENNMYISGVHAQLKYNAQTGWCVVDKHSSNGTTLNKYTLQPDVEMSLKTGDILSLANINLQVNIS